MAMRQRVTAANSSHPRQSIRPHYEDFKPNFELLDNAQARIILVQLPGFLKEQVRITFVHAPGLIRVHGQRPLGNNRWSRFNQTFPLPLNCQDSKIHGKFSSGVLTITLPKEIPDEVDQPSNEEEATSPILQDAMPKTSAAEADPQKLPSKEMEKQMHAPPSKQHAGQPKVQEGHDATHQTAIASELGTHKGPGLVQGHKDKEAGLVSAMTQNEKLSDEKRVIALSNIVRQPPHPKMGRDEIMPHKKAKEYYDREVQDRYITEENGKPGEAHHAEKDVDLLLSKGKEITGDFIAETPAKQDMKNVEKWLNKEEKQLLINVGAAVLVLVAFGAYMTYSL